MRKSKTVNCSDRATLQKGTSDLQQPERRLLELEYPHRGRERHHQTQTNPQRGLERHHQGLERSHQEPQHRHQRMQHCRKRRECYYHQEPLVCFIRGLTSCFARGRTFYFGWVRTVCTASRNRSYETQPKCRGDLQQQARQEGVGSRPTSIGIDFGLWRRNTGCTKSPPKHQDAIRSPEQHHPGLRKRWHL